jgi:hypothetical protein
MSRTEPQLAICVIVLALGCTSASGGASGLDGGGESTGAAELVGAFEIRLVPATTMTAAFTSVSGRVHDGPQPQDVVMKVVKTMNGCALRTPRVPFCRTECPADSACVDDDRCRRFPAAKEVGTVRVTGLGPNELAMQPIAGNYQPAADVALPYPPFAEGAPISLHTEGGAYPPFTLAGRGIEPLSVPDAGALAVRAGAPLVLAWSRPGDASLARVEVRVDVSHHGGLKGDLVCDVPDSGALEIPAALVDALVALGTAGFPSVTITRAATSFATIPPGRVALAISTMLERPLTIPGLVSCNPGDCPGGTTCQPEHTCK